MLPGSSKRIFDRVSKEATLGGFAAKEKTAAKAIKIVGSSVGCPKKCELTRTESSLIPFGESLDMSNGERSTPTSETCNDTTASKAPKMQCLTERRPSDISISQQSNDTLKQYAVYDSRYDARLCSSVAACDGKRQINTQSAILFSGTKHAIRDEHMNVSAQRRSGCTFASNSLGYRHSQDLDIVEDTCAAAVKEPRTWTTTTNITSTSPISSGPGFTKSGFAACSAVRSSTPSGSGSKKSVLLDDDTEPSGCSADVTKSKYKPHIQLHSVMLLDITLKIVMI